MPTSAARRAGESLMPSPRKPTTCLLLCKARMIRCLWLGERRAKSVVFSAASANSASDMFSTCAPTKTCSAGSPTSWQILRLTNSLSPVSVFTVMPWAVRASMAGAAVSLGGSRNAT